MSEPASVLSDEPISVSNSEIQMFQKCRRRWYLAYYQGWRPKDAVVTGPLALGTRVHAALEAYYKDQGPLVDHYLLLLNEDRLLAASMGQDLTALESEGDLGRLMLEGYLDWVAEEGIDSLYEIVGVEEILTMPMLGGAINVIGKIDLRVRDKRDGAHLVLDHKGQPLDEVVLTPDGWAPIGKLDVGDFVIGSAWQPIRVLGVYERGLRDVYRVHFSDGTSVRCDDEHVWPVEIVGRTQAVLGIQEIKDVLDRSGTRTTRKGLSYKRGAYITSVTTTATEKRRTPLMLEPYTLGVWIADGDADGCKITDALHERPRLEFADCKSFREHIRPHSSGLYASLPSGGRDALRRMNLLGLQSHERFIPNVYLQASYPDRLMLARSLMDGDGSITTSGSAVYLTSSPRLAEDFALLARSLGWQASIWKHEEPHYTYQGERRIGRPAYRVNVTTDVNPFLFSERNLPLWEMNNGGVSGKGRRDRRKRISWIEKIEPAECRCIKVDSYDNLYVTAGGVLTHNTTAALGDFESWAHMNPQLMTYQTLDFINRTGEDRDERLAGGIFRLLKKVKRGVRAKPPFYAQHEVRHNVFTLRSFWWRLQGVLTDMLDTRQALESGQDHRVAAYPTPTRDCRWWCPFFQVCPLMDDGSDVEAMFADLYQKGDPYGHYKDRSED